MAFTSNHDLNILQASDSQNVGAGAGNDTYIVTPTTMSAGQEINITDTEGANNIKLVGGVTIVSSTVSANSIQLTINNGGIINIFGADTFSYILGGDAFDATSGVSQSFTDFVTNSLGLGAVPTGTNTANGTTTNESVNEDGTIGTPTPTFALAGAASVDEGATANFTLTTTNVADGTTINYTIAGVSAADVTGGLTGTATVTGNTATIAVPVVADTTTEGAETLTVSIDGQAGVSASTTVNDTSTTPTTPTFDLAANAANANEGTTATFTLTTTNVADGTSVAYTVSGVDAADVDSLTGTATVNSNTATISVALTEDNTTEGAETLTVGIDGQTASAVVTVNDTSLDPVNQTFTLTTNPDGFTGGVADDLFVASNATLSAADVLDGGDGTDTLRYASSGADAVNESGFAASNIENLNIIADATGGTTFDVTGASGVQKVTNDNSSGNLTLSGGNSLYDLELKNVTGGNTVVDNDASAVTGSSDTQNVVLDGVESIADTAVSSLTVDTGIETVAITTQNGSSQLTDLVAAGGNTVTVAGDQDLSITDTLDGIATVDASTFTGKLSVQADAGESLNVTGGTGDDTVTINATSLSSNDTLNGGAGTDTLSLSNTQAVAGTGSASISNFEQLGVADAASGTIDMDNFANFSKVILDGGLGGNVLIDDAVTGITVEVDQNTAAGNTFEVDLKTDGNADEITLLFDDIDDADAIGAVTANDAETLNLNGSKLSSGSSQDLTIADLNATDATTINITSDALLDLSDADTTKVTVVNAAASTGNLDLEELDLSSSGATVTLGSGADTITSGGGADTITGGDGKDSFKFTAANQSDNAGTDTIKDFVSGTDIIDLKSLTNQGGNSAVVSSSQFKGVFNDFGSAQGALTGSAGTQGADPGRGDTVFEANFDGSGNGRLWVDIDGDGTLSNTDLRIVLESVSTITAADLGLGLTGNTITLSAASANVDLTTSTNANTTATNEDDTINSTDAFLSASTVDGELGNNTLNITDQATNGNSGAGATTLTSIEVINLQAGSGADWDTEALADLTINNTSASATASVDLANVAQTYNGNGAVDTVTLGSEGDTLSMGGGNDVIDGATDAMFDGNADGVITSIDGGGDADSLTFANNETLTDIDFTVDTVTNVETIDAGTVGGASTVTIGDGVTTLLGNTGTANIGWTLTSNQADALTTVTQAGAGNAMTLNISDTASIDFTGATLANDAAGALALSTTGANDAITVTATQFNNTGNAGFDNIDLAGGTDTITVTAGAATITAANTTNVENVTLGTGGTNIVDSNAGGSVTMAGNSANNTFDIQTTTATAAKTVDLTGGGDDIIQHDADTSTVVVTMNNFTNDVFDFDDTTAVTTTAVSGTAAAITSAAAGAATNAYLLQGAGNQINGALTATADGGAVELALFAGGHDAGDSRADTEEAYFIMDNGTDTGIYRAVFASSAAALDNAAEVALTLVGTITGVVADDLTAANFS